MKQDGVQSLRRAIEILLLLGSEGKTEWGVTDIGRELGLPKSTVHRLLSTLEAYGLVEQNPETALYRLGLRLFELGSVVLKNMNLRRIALPIIQELSARCGETVHLGVLSDWEVLSIEEAESPLTLKATVYIGKRAPLHCTAVGKALLAFLKENELEAIIAAKGLKKYTENTITDPALLKEHLSQIRARGFAVDNEEHELGVRCVGAPVFDHEGKVVASISASGPSFRITEDRVNELALEVIAAAQRISGALGYPGGHKGSA